MDDVLQRQVVLINGNGVNLLFVEGCTDDDGALVQFWQVAVVIPAAVTQAPVLVVECDERNDDGRDLVGKDMCESRRFELFNRVDAKLMREERIDKCFQLSPRNLEELHALIAGVFGVAHHGGEADAPFVRECPVCQLA